MKMFPVFISILAIIITITSYSTGQDKHYKIGDQCPAGCWIFYDKGNNDNGWRFLEAAPVDQSKGFSWNNKKDIVTGASGADIETGRSNTVKIIRVQGAGVYAAKLCADYRGG